MKLYGSVRNPDTFFRKTGNGIARRLQSTAVTANHVSVFRLFFVPVVFICYLSCEPVWIFAGAVIYEIFILLDFVDGALARLKKQESKLGIFIEEVLDPVLVGSGGLFGLVVAVTVHRMTGDPSIFIVALVNAVSLYHKKHNGGIEPLLGADSAPAGGAPEGPAARHAVRNFFLVSLWWNEQYIIWASWLFVPLSLLPVNPLYLGFLLTTLVTTAGYAHSVVKLGGMIKK